MLTPSTEDNQNPTHEITKRSASIVMTEKSNLFDMNAKYGDVVSESAAIEHLAGRATGSS